MPELTNMFACPKKEICFKTNNCAHFSIFSPPPSHPKYVDWSEANFKVENHFLQGSTSFPFFVLAIFWENAQVITQKHCKPIDSVHPLQLFSCCNPLRTKSVIHILPLGIRKDLICLGQLGHAVGSLLKELTWNYHEINYQQISNRRSVPCVIFKNEPN